MGSERMRSDQRERRGYGFEDLGFPNDPALEEKTRFGILSTLSPPEINAPWENWNR
jgi:hypothetical protein